MTTQTELFPKTTMEVLESLRAFHVADVEKAGKTLDDLSDDEKVARRYEKAEERLAAARDLVRDIDRAIEELSGGVAEVEDAFRDMKRHAEESGTTVTLSTGGKSVTFGGKPVDPITGEVTSKDGPWSCAGCGKPIHGEVFYDDDRPYDEACWRALPGNADDEEAYAESIGGIDPPPGHDAPAAMGERPELTIPVVVACYPGDDEPHETQVGDRTRYGELVADYFTAVGPNFDVDVDELTVVARRELTHGGAGRRNLRDVISPEDYGQELLVVALEQGSVTGAPPEKVAT